tara:strand:- start:395 stop:943 length:549 start_codon:yes stop_codon:yes gene_type:complete
MSQLKVNSIIPVGGVPTGGGGGIIQVKQTVKTSLFSTTTTGNTIDVTGVSVEITPTSTSSKMFVMCSGYYGNGNNDSFGHLRLANVIDGTENMHMVRGDTNSNATRAAMSASLRSGGGESSNISRHFSIHYLDSPNTTNAVTYKLMLLVTQGTPATIGGSSGNNDSNRGAYPTIITAMEVSA